MSILVKMFASIFRLFWASFRLISIAWEVAGRRYDDAKLAKKTASTLLSDGKVAGSLEMWKCQTSGGSLFSYIYLFHCNEFCGII